MKFKHVNRTLFLLGFLALTGAGQAQETTWTVQQNRGWIGIRISYSSAMVAGREQTVAIIQTVEENSPAQNVEILPGDTITHLDGQQLSQKVLENLTQTLKPGDLIRVTLLREGRTRDALVEAGTWPTQEGVIVMPELGEVVIRLDTVQQVILNELDQMRLRIGELHLDSDPARLRLSILRTAPREDEGKMTVTYRIFEPAFDSLTFSPNEFFFPPDFALPFQASMVESRAARSLRDDQMRVREELNEVRRMERARRIELLAVSPGTVEELVRTDQRVRELRAREGELEEQHEALVERLRQVGEEELRRRAAMLQVQQEEAWLQARSAQEQNRQLYEEVLQTQEAAEAITYSRLLAVGRGLVAGAQLQPLNPRLAEYFHVDGGVLVLDVLEGTPAADADLQGGDVIITVGGDSVASLDDLKFGLAYLGRPLRLEVIRNGRPLDVILRR
jgi:membrane-associated protease RseP (regulator of RpoE activity)